MKNEGLTEVGVEMWPMVWTDYKVFRATSLSLLDMDERAVRDGALSAAALAKLDEALTDADRRGVFFASAAIVVAHGRRDARVDATTNRIGRGGGDMAPNGSTTATRPGRSVS